MPSFASSSTSRSGQLLPAIRLPAESLSPSTRTSTARSIGALPALFACGLAAEGCQHCGFGGARHQVVPTLVEVQLVTAHRLAVDSLEGLHAINPGDVALGGFGPQVGEEPLAF